MKNSFLISLICLFAFQIKSQNNADSVNIENQKLINALKNRLNTIENIGNPNNVSLDEIAKLKTEIKVDNDSIKELNKLLVQFSKGQLGKIKTEVKTQNDSIVELNRLLTQLRKGQTGKANNFGSEMSDRELNANLNRNPSTSKQLTNCNCFRLFYKPYQTELDFKTFSELDSIITILKNNPTAKLKLIGHADKSGHEEENLILSENRVVTLKKYLVSLKVINKNNISIEWHGSAMPQVDTKDLDRQYLNRRAEVIVLQ